MITPVSKVMIRSGRDIFFIDPVPLARLDDDQDDVLSLQRTRIEIGVAIGFAAHLPFRKIIVESGKPLSQRGVVGRLSEKLVQDIGNIYEVKYNVDKGKNLCYTYIIRIREARICY